MQIIEAEMQKGALLMRYICPKIFATDNVPPASKLTVQLALDNSCHLAVFLGLENPLHIRHLLYR